VQILGCASIRVQKANRRSGLFGILALAMLAISIPESGFPQVPIEGNTSQSVPVVSPLGEAEELIQQGLFEQARKIIGDQLKRNASRVDAYTCWESPIPPKTTTPALSTPSSKRSNWLPALSKPTTTWAIYMSLNRSSTSQKKNLRKS